MREEKGENTMSTAELVYNFFEFYSHEMSTDQMISVKSASFPMKPNKADTTAFSIIDPFQIEHNPGQSVMICVFMYIGKSSLNVI